MSRFLICSFALVLLYPAGIDMYLVGLPRIAADLNARWGTGLDMGDIYVTCGAAAGLAASLRGLLLPGEEVIAFANTDGGKIYIGINDDGSVQGIQNPDGTITDLSQYDKTKNG